MSMRIGSLVQAGGLNSIENFARSWQRASGFSEITPSATAFAISEDENDRPGPGVRRTDEEHAGPGSSLLRAQLEGRRRSSSTVEDIAAFNESDEESAASDRKPLLSAIPHVPPGVGSGYDSTYGTISARINDDSLQHAARLFQEQQSSGLSDPDGGREPLLVKRVEQDGKIINVVVGQSTLPQTIFNSVNVLIGVGLLSLPLGVKYAGWLFGLVFLLLSAVTTSYTAKLLARCLDVDASLVTFADIAYASFGSQARIATSILFSIELIAACVALIVLFADSLDALLPGWGSTTWKLVCGLLLIPSGFVPLRILSFSSFIGILCCFGSTPKPFVPPPSCLVLS